MSRTAACDPQRPAFPRTPCIDICKLDGNNVCIGCLRTIDEIVRWSTMTADEQWRVVRDLPERRA